MHLQPSHFQQWYSTDGVLFTFGSYLAYAVVYRFLLNLYLSAVFVYFAKQLINYHHFNL